MNEATLAIGLLFGYLGLMLHGCFDGIYGDAPQVKPPRDGGHRAPLRGRLATRIRRWSDEVV